MIFRYICFLLLWSSRTLGFKSFQQRIPNGDSVPHPCKPNFLWHGVGHENELGGGSRNKFGLDFAAAGLVRCYVVILRMKKKHFLLPESYSPCIFSVIGEIYYGNRMVPGKKNILSGGRHLLTGGRHLII